LGTHRFGSAEAIRALFAAYLPHALVAALAVLLGVPTLIMPLHPDQALFALIGEAVGEGRFPYVDAWDVKTPGVFFIYAVAVRGPWDLTQNVRVFDLAWTATAAAVVVELGRRWWSLRAGVIAGMLYALVIETGQPWVQSAQPDSLLALPLLLALLVVDGAWEKRTRLLGAGLLFGFACQLRAPVVLLVPLVPLIGLGVAPAGERQRAWLWRLAWLGAGVLAAQALLVAYLLAGGALGEFWQTLRYGAWYTRQGGPWNGANGPTLGGFFTAVRLGFWYWSNTRIVLTGPALAGGVLGALVLRERRVSWLLLLTAAACVGVVVQVKLFWYQFGPLVPLLALLSGWTWDSLLSAAVRARGRVAAYAGGGALAAAVLFGSTEVWDNGRRDWLNSVAYLRHPEEREALRNEYAAYPARERVAAYLAAQTTPGERIYVWGFDPHLYLLSGRASASRFLVSFPLMSDWAPAGWRASFLAELEAQPPRYIVVQRGHAGSWVVGRDLDLADAAAEFVEFQHLLAAGYDLEREIDGRVLYRRRD